MSAKFRAPSDTARAREIEDLVKLIASALDKIVQGLGAEVGTTQIVLADDFAAEVDATIRTVRVRDDQPNDRPFRVERLGGNVMGKTLPHDDAYLDATILIDARDVDWADQAVFAMGISFIAHELAHVCICRARWAAGIRERATYQPETGTEVSRAIARISTDEYRANVLANIVVGALMSVSLNANDVRPITIHDIIGDAHTDRLQEVLDEVVHPGWPNTVNAYRNGRISLDDLSERIFEETSQVFTILGHAESHAEVGSRPRPLDACADHRGVKLYLRSAWEQLIAPARTTGPVPLTLPEVRALDDEIVSGGGEAILAMWSTLGLTVDERPDGRWALWVAEPEV